MMVEGVLMSLFELGVELMDIISCQLVQYRDDVLINVTFVGHRRTPRQAGFACLGVLRHEEGLFLPDFF